MWSLHEDFIPIGTREEGHFVDVVYFYYFWLVNFRDL